VYEPLSFEIENTPRVGLPRRLCVSLASGCAYLENRTVALTGRELQLLSAIGMRAGWASTESLVDKIWPDCDPFDARQTLYVYVHRIRARLGRRDVLALQLGRWSLGPGVTFDVWEWERLARSGAAPPLMEALRAALRNACDALISGPAPCLQSSAIAGDIETLFAQIRDRVAELLLDDARVRGDTLEIRKLANALIAVDPYSERWREALVTSLLMVSDVCAARAALQCYARLLQNDLSAPLPARLKAMVAQA
jgi:DNA-binding SARP family transcriptional activator